MKGKRERKKVNKGGIRGEGEEKKMGERKIIKNSLCP